MNIIRKILINSLLGVALYLIIALLLGVEITTSKLAYYVLFLIIGGLMTYFTLTVMFKFFGNQIINKHGSNTHYEDFLRNFTSDLQSLYKPLIVAIKQNKSIRLANYKVLNDNITLHTKKSLRSYGEVITIYYKNIANRDILAIASRCTEPSAKTDYGINKKNVEIIKTILESIK